MFWIKVRMPVRDFDLFRLEMRLFSVNLLVQGSSTSFRLELKLFPFVYDN